MVLYYIIPTSELALSIILLGLRKPGKGKYSTDINRDCPTMKAQSFTAACALKLYLDLNQKQIELIRIKNE